MGTFFLKISAIPDVGQLLGEGQVTSIICAQRKTGYLSFSSLTILNKLCNQLYL